MRILILGGDGYLGWPTAMYFSRRGHDVRVRSGAFEPLSGAVDQIIESHFKLFLFFQTADFISDLSGFLKIFVLDRLMKIFAQRFQIIFLGFNGVRCRGRKFFRDFRQRLAQMMVGPVDLF